MAVSQVYVLHGVQTPNVFYGQITQHANSSGVDQMLQYSAGYPVPLYRGVRGAKPIVTFTTTQLATLIGECGIYGVDQSGGNVDLYYRLATDRGSRASPTATVHYRFRMQNAFMFWRRIQANNQGEATAEVTIYGLFDGTNPPVVPAGSTALAGTPTAAESFGLGPIVINGSVYSGFQSASLDLGVELIERSDQSDPWMSFCGIKQLNPIVTASGLNPAAWTTLGVLGSNLTSFILYLRKRNLDCAGDAAYVADGTSQHIAVSSSKGMIMPQQSSGGGNTELITGIWAGLVSPDGTSDPLSVSAAATIASPAA